MIHDLAVVLVAAGASRRMGFDKVWAELDGRPLLAWIADTASAAGAAELVVVVSAEHVQRAQALLPNATVVQGGARRRDSVAAGLAASTAPWLAIHDAARAFAPTHLFADGLVAARTTGAAVPVLPVKDTIKQVAEGRVVRTVPRAGLGSVQTPQVFRRDLLQHALVSTDQDVTDEAALLEAMGIPIATFPGHEHAFKVTTPIDMDLARVVIQRGAGAWGAASVTGAWGLSSHGEERTPSPTREGPGGGGRANTNHRVGLGTDVHALKESTPLWLGGVHIPHSRGLAGHSDGDAALHALVDALLGAAGRGDIGEWFPSSDERWRGAHSGDFVRHVWGSLAAEGWQVENADLTIVAAEPRLSAHRTAMRTAIATLLEVTEERVSVKATTTDGLGALGRAEGVMAQAVVLLSRQQP